MKIFGKNPILLGGGVLIGLASLSLQAHATPISYGTAGVAYTENFDSLLNTGTANTGGPAGFEYAQGTRGTGSTSASPGTAVYQAGTGSGTGGGLYSFGATSSTERAFGSLASGNAAAGVPIYYGFAFTNTTGATLNTIDITYNGEQWRNGGKTTSETLAFQYRIGDAGNTTDNILSSSANYTGVTALNYNSGTLASATAGALDGNANSQTISGSITGLTIANNQTVWLRWNDVDDAGSDHGLAIDNFSFTASVATPEPETWAMMGLGVCALAVLQFRRKRSANDADFGSNLAI